MAANDQFDEDDKVCNTLLELSVISAEPPMKRSLCVQCRRPSRVCWCTFLPSTPLDVSCKVVILQHPAEEKRCLRTSPILEVALPKGHCIVRKGRKFSSERNNDMQDILTSQDTLVLYPGEKATDLTELPTVKSRGSPYNIVILDGTWSQARSIFYNSKELHGLKQVQLQPGYSSSYVIRTQPTSECLSTVETVAVTLSYLEESPKIHELLVHPLKAMCQFQLDHGAVPHQSKEFLIQNGLYKKPLPRKIIHKVSNHEDIKHILR
ncbi:DTW domain-containing protein 2-like [Limulus polyphemus]|uniref:tRNA-uridine aminocarboxypropyltransferase n=1 Tax=Limulus polyphemus TaxID=6850 RepID=A0ABM1BL77_LIMPO|nr:DTW domain-containing protein 2-like [Limulus polyphemus]